MNSPWWWTKAFRMRAHLQASQVPGDPLGSISGYVPSSLGGGAKDLVRPVLSPFYYYVQVDGHCSLLCITRDNGYSRALGTVGLGATAFVTATSTITTITNSSQLSK